MFEGLRRNVLVMILAGGEGTRLKPLTEDRAKPAVPFGGRYRIIDFALSNFVNSGFYKIKILTQYKSDSLNKHISRGWRLSAKLGHYVEAVPAQMRRGPEWYKGSADAIFQNMNLITDEKPDFVIVFGADHIYKMDVSQMLEYHEEKGAICTVAAIPVSVEQAKSFGVIQVDEDWRIIGFQEKPAEPKTIPGRPDMALASMGNYIFSIDTITESIERDAIDENSTHDFGKNIIPALVDSKKLFAYDFSRNNVPGMTEHERGYWRDVGDIDAYWAASMDLVAVDPVFNLYNRLWPIYGESEVAPPAKFVFADDENKRIGLATDSLVSEGCIVSGGRIHRTILGPWARINSYSHVEDSVIMDRVDVGRHAQIRRAILDKDVKVAPNAVIGFDPEHDAKRFYVTSSGIVVVPKGTHVEA